LDLADGLFEMLKVGGGWGETYHLAGNGAATWCEFAREIMMQCAAVGAAHVPVEPIGTGDWPTRAPRPQSSLLDSGKFEHTFGFSMPDWRFSTRNVVERSSQAR
jgi:dTDP-4-dehydrorhamnose reductase